MQLLILIFRKIRSLVKRLLFSSENYLAKRSLFPLSKKYGFDRGKPVDRYYIEKFLKEHKSDVKGKVLEVVDDTYTKMFGEKNVMHSDVIDIYPTKMANIQDDLRKLKTIKNNTYDCLIVTQTFNVIDDVNSAISECSRILKVGGVLLVTVPTISPTWNLGINFWRFSVLGARAMFSRFFKDLKVVGVGNKDVVRGFWVGMSADEFSNKQLLDSDSDYPLIIGIRAVKA